MDNSEEERDRERNEFERYQEHDEERDRERDGGWGREREALSRRVTGAESHHRSREILKRVLKGGASGGTPPKRLHPEPVRPHTDTVVGARPKEPATRYRGTEPSDPRRGGQASTSEHRARDETRVPHECRRLFDNDAREQDEFTYQFIGAAEVRPQAELNEIIAIMDKDQLVASLQHMAHKWKALQGDATAGAPPTQTFDQRQPALAAYNRDTHNSCNHVNPKNPTLSAGTAPGPHCQPITPRRSLFFRSV